MSARVWPVCFSGFDLDVFQGLTWMFQVDFLLIEDKVILNKCV